MISSLLCGILAGQEALRFGKFATRQEFARAMPRVISNYTPMGDYSRAKVEAMLGKPDDIWPLGDSTRYTWMAGSEIWCYGTNGHHTFPTVGSVLFFRDRAVFMRGGELPNSKSGITEVELRNALRSLYRMEYMDLLAGQTQIDCSDPLRLIQATNDLIPLGTEKALAAIEFYASMQPGCHDDFLFWLVRTLFVGKSANYSFPEPAHGIMEPKPPKDLSTWPLYPMFIEQDFPVNAVRFSGMQGSPFYFKMYFSANKADWQIRSKPLTPPNDPFPIYQKLAKQYPWLLRDERDEKFRKELESTLSKQFEGVKVEPNEDSIIALQRSILFGIRNVLKLDLGNIKPKQFEAIHQRFLKLGGHWDPKNNCYVRKDGSFDKDLPAVHHNVYYEFPQVGPISASVKSDTPTIVTHNLEVAVYEEKGRMASTAVIRVVDAKTGKVLDFISPNAKESTNGKTLTESQLLKQPKHKAGTQGGMVIMTANITPGKPVIFVLVYEGKEYKSPAFLID